MTTTSPARRLAVPVDSTRDHIQGPDDAPVTLVEYGDFECPFCGMAYKNLKEIRSRLGHRLRFVFRHFPRPEHPHARDAAEASECAAAQDGDHFWSMHDALFEHQDALDGDSLSRYATAIGLDSDRFARDMGSNVYLRHVQEDLRGAAQRRAWHAHVFHQRRAVRRPGAAGRAVPRVAAASWRRSDTRQDRPGLARLVSSERPSGLDQHPRLS